MTLHVNAWFNQYHKNVPFSMAQLELHTCTDLTLKKEAPVSQWNTHWPADLLILVSIPI